MALQLGPNTVTAYRVETTPGTLATNDATARVFRTNAGPGLALTKTPIPSNEIRATLDQVRPRHGVRDVAGSLSGDLSLSTFDPLIEAAFRGTFSSVLTSASFSLTYVQSTGILTRSTGSFVGEGFKVGDVVTLANAGANSAIPAVLVAVGTTTCTVGNRLALVDATSVAGVTMVRPKKVIQATSPVQRSFSIEHWSSLAPASERFVGCKVSSLAFSQPADGMVGIDVGFMGLDMLAVQATQYFTSATGFTSLPMAAPDAVICYAGAQQLAVQSLSLSMNLQTDAPSVVGSLISPSVFDGVMQVTGTITLMRQDATNLAAFVNETPLSLTLLYREVGTAGFIAISVPAFTLGSVTAQNRISPSGPVLETCEMLVGVGTGTDRDPSMITCITSAT